MKIKICGLFREEDIEYANQALPDYAGFVFAPRSRRCIGPEKAAKLREKLDRRIIPVGVFVREEPEKIAALYHGGIIGMAQLHGGEDGEYIARLKEICGAPLILARTVSASKPGDSADGMGDSMDAEGADYILFDSGAGGSGQSFDWRLLARVAGLSGCPFFLAGGIGLHNIEKAMSCKPYAIDISSGAESGGVKDREKMIALVEKVRAYKGRYT
ncbi:MAG: phosphoribosylanthranilate isomerase [Spirochaetales bacterium]|jgi:phosphoribosylanthranilate isomerase|nr:phosphoribosylanthranilate isomerase [Spirochaetales bacterium]